MTRFIETVEEHGFEYENLILEQGDSVIIYYRDIMRAIFRGKDTYKVQLKIIRSLNGSYSHYDLLIDDRYVGNFFEIDKYEIEER